MITEEQQKWLDHLNDTDKVAIIPWDNTSEEKYQIVKRQIQNLLGDKYRVEHRGASSLKISGQDEIDIYIPVKESLFDQMVEKINELYGSPRSHYSLKRARFVTSVQDKHLDVFVINEDNISWKDSEIFHNFLLSYPDELIKYRDLKEKMAGKSTKAYYTAKTEFINEIVSRSKAEQRPLIPKTDSSIAY